MGIELRLKKKMEGFTLDLELSDSAGRIGILGSSGAGKSLTLKMIAGIERPDEGRIVLNDRVLFDSEKRIDIKPQKRNTGYLFQNYALFPTMNVAENIGAALGRKDREEKRRRVSDIIDKFKLNGLEERLPSELSGGQQQRVALARIMVYEPEAILLDEPFSALDAHLRDHMQEELISIFKDYPGTVIMVSHSRDEIYRFSESLIIMDRGRLESHGETKRIFEAPGTRAAAVLTGCKNISDVRVIDSHTLEALDWGVTLRIKKPFPPDITCIGYRAHLFEPVWGEREENCIPFQLSSVSALPFERKYYIKAKKTISWFAERSLWPLLENRGNPSYLRLREEDILYLRE